MASRQTSAQKYLTKSEFKLVSQSMPKEISKLSDKKIGTALTKAEELIAKYRLAARKFMSVEKSQQIENRLNNLLKARDRYFKRATGKRRAQPTQKVRRSMTEQQKMHVPLLDNAREAFLRQGKEKIYSRLTTERNNNVSSRASGTKIMARSNSQNKRAQVGRDRRKAQRENAA